MSSLHYDFGITGRRCSKALRLLLYDVTLNWHMLRLMGKLFGGKKKAAGFEMTPYMMTMMNGFTVLRLLTMAGGMMNVKFAKEDLLKLNARLNRVKQPGKK